MKEIHFLTNYNLLYFQTFLLTCLTRNQCATFWCYQNVFGKFGPFQKHEFTLVDWKLFQNKRFKHGWSLCRRNQRLIDMDWFKFYFNEICSMKINVSFIYILMSEWTAPSVKSLLSSSTKSWDRSLECVNMPTLVNTFVASSFKTFIFEYGNGTLEYSEDTI